MSRPHYLAPPRDQLASRLISWSPPWPLAAPPFPPQRGTPLCCSDGTWGVPVPGSWRWMLEESLNISWVVDEGSGLGHSQLGKGRMPQ